jgi:DNA-binding response OmpR family regulator
MLKEARNSPRNLMRLGSLLFAEHCRDRVDPESVLQPETWERALERFRSTVLREPEVVNDGALAAESATASQDISTPLSTSQVIPPLRVDVQAGRVYRGIEEIVGMADLEYRLLELLYLHRGQVCTKETIVHDVYAAKYAPEAEDSFDGVSDEAISRLIRRVRLRIEPEPRKEPIYLKTVKGRGYLLDHTE